MKAETSMFLEVMAKAVGNSIPGMPRDRRAMARRIILKVFNNLSDSEVKDSSSTMLLDLMTGIFDGLNPTWFLSTISRPFLWGANNQGTTGLIKSFRGFILCPEQGLLMQAMDEMYENAVRAVQDTTKAASRLSGQDTALMGENRGSFELVRGEDGS